MIRFVFEWNQYCQNTTNQAAAIVSSHIANCKLHLKILNIAKLKNQLISYNFKQSLQVLPRS